MRLRILSDLHLEFGPFDCPEVDSDVDAVVLAGDIQPGLKGLRWIQKTFPETPVIYVAGNHEFYAKILPSLLDDLREAARGTNVHFLDNNSVTVGDTCFWGATLWSDLGLNRNPVRSAEIAGDEVTDDQIAETRVVCNPRGYPFQNVPGFNPGFILEV